jgi:plastocyanin
MSRTSPALVGLVFLATLGGCSSDNGAPAVTRVIAKTATNSGDAQAGTAGTALANPLRVVVTDDGALASGVTVTWATTGGGTLLPSGTTDASGIASATWTLGSGGGAQTATASVSGATGSPVSFSATSPVVQPDVLAKTATNSGDAQTGTAGAVLANPLRVVVTQNGVAKPGVTVTWATATGSLAPGGVTDASGIATAAWTLSAGGGAQSATASVTGATGSPVTFTATAPVVPTITVGANGSLQFSPSTITISAGQSVRFVWGAGATNHNVSPASGNASALPASPGLPVLLDAPQDFNVAFPTAGTFRFFCTAHGNNPTANSVTGMSGTVTVN